MKNILILLLLIHCSAAAGTTYYISPTGSDSNFGASATPWKTLRYACSRVTRAGDIIHVYPGTFIETAQCLLAPGVSITGEGNSSVIHSHFAGNLIELYNASLTNGNQSISYILMEGGTTVSDLTGNTAIEVYGRYNVAIHNCTFRNFSIRGVVFYGGATIPSVYPTGNKFYNNVMTNCSKMNPGDGNSGQGSLCIGGQQGMLVYNNSITNNQRPSGNNGYCIKYFGNKGLNKGLKIYDNTLIADQCPSKGYNFAIELWFNAGGCEIYNNNIKGTIDIPNSYRDLSSIGVPYPEGPYSYGTKIYNNTIGWDTSMPIGSGDGEFGFRLEAHQDYTYIYNNLIRNVSVGIECNTADATPGEYQNNIFIYHNIFENIGSSSTINSKGWGIHVAPGINAKYNNWNIVNNVISGKTTGATTMWGINLPGGKDGNTVTGLTIRNNIIQNFDYAAIKGEEEAFPVAGISVENNIFYKNGYNNSVRSNTSGWQNYVFRNNLTSDPMFVSSNDFHLKPGSPAIGKGLKIDGITTDLEGNLLKDPPSIGCFEYYETPPPVYQNSVIGNDAPAILELTYNLSLAAIVPSAGSFSVLVNSLPREVTSINISGYLVQLTLESPVQSGDFVTVSYLKPDINPLQTPSGGEASVISSKLVTNNCISYTDELTASMILYPNPAQYYFNISLENQKGKPSSIRIVDYGGKIVFEDSYSHSYNKIELPDSLYSGIYFVELFSGNMILNSQKLIIRK